MLSLPRSPLGSWWDVSSRPVPVGGGFLCTPSSWSRSIPLASTVAAAHPFGGAPQSLLPTVSREPSTRWVPQPIGADPLTTPFQMFQLSGVPAVPQSAIDPPQICPWSPPVLPWASVQLLPCSRPSLPSALCDLSASHLPQPYLVLLTVRPSARVHCLEVRLPLCLISNACSLVARIYLLHCCASRTSHCV